MCLHATSLALPLADIGLVSICVVFVFASFPEGAGRVGRVKGIVVCRFGHPFPQNLRIG